MLNQKLRAAREKKHWSMETAAEKIGVSKTSIARWENGEQKPRGASLDLVCTAYGMSAEELGLANDALESFSPLSALAQDEIIMRLSVEQVNQLSLLLEAEYNNMTHFDSSRREALEQLCKVIGITAITPQIGIQTDAWERLFQAPSKPSSMNEETLNHFQKLLEGCWGLTNSGEMGIAHQTLATFLPQMMQIAPHQSEAAALAAQGLRLQSIPYAHHLKFFDKINLCQQAVEYSKLSNDKNAFVAASIELAVAFKYAYKPAEAFAIYEGILHQVDDISPLLRSRLYSAIAAAYAQKGENQEARSFISLAYKHFPDTPEEDTHFLLADNSIFLLAYYEGLIHLENKQPREALRVLDSLTAHPSTKTLSERSKIEILNYKARLATSLGDLDLYANCLEEGLNSAIKLKSQRRFHEAIHIFQHDVPSTWYGEQQIKQVAEKFNLPQPIK